ATTVPAGSSVTITIHAKNANNTPQTVGGIPIVCSIASGSSTGTFTPVVDNNDGTYTTTFTANQVGTAIAVGLATNLNFNIDTPLSLNVVPGPVSPLTSTLNLSQMVISSGNSALVTATLKDAFGNPVTSGINVAFTTSTGNGESTGTFSAITNQGGGVYTADFTGVVAGTARSIGVSVGGVNLAGISQSITVVPGAPVSSNSTIAVSTSTLSSGASATVTAVLKDINSNPVPSGLVVTFNKVGGTSTGDFSASVVNAGAGVYTTTYTGIVAGTAQTLSVSVGGVQLSPTTTVTVVPGAPSAAQSTLTLSSNSVNSGNFITVTATLKDINLNPITAGTISFNKSGGTSTGTLSAVVNNGGGNYSIRYTGVVAGTAQTLSVLYNGVAIAGLSDTVQVLPGAPTSANSTLTISSSSISSGSSAVITATLRDANNNFINSPVSSVSFSKSGGTSTGTFDSVVSSTPGIYTINYTGILAGSSQSIGVIVDGSPLALSTNVTVVPGSVSSSQSSFSLSLTTLPSGQSSVMTATLKDAAGNLIPSGVTVSFAASGGTSTGTIGSVTNQGAGVYSANFAGVVAGTAKTISVLVNGTTLTALNQSLTVVPGSASSANSTIAISSSTVASGSSVSIVATLKDINNNVIPSGVSASFNKIGGTSTGDFDSSVINNGDGSYSTNYTGILAGTAQTISVSVNSANLTPTVSVTVVAGAPSLTYSSLTALAPTVSSGSSVSIIANLRDANLNPITSGTVSFTKTGGTSTGTFGSVSGSNGSYSVQYTGIGAGTAQTLGVLLNGVAISGLSASIAVIPGPASASKSSLTLSSATVPSGASINITASIVDDNNNPISSGITVGFSKVGGTSTGVLSAISNSGSGIYTATYTGFVSGTAQTIGLMVDGVALGLASSITVVPGSPSALNSTFTVSSSTVVAGSSVTLTATVRDSNNNPIPTGILVSFTAAGGSSTGLFGTVVSNGDGTYSGQFTGVGSGTAKTLSVNINGSNFGTTSSVQVLTGPPSPVTSSISVAAGTVPSGNTAVVTATLRDSQNNAVTSGTVSFTKTGGTSTGFFDGTVTSGNGVYTSNYTGVLAGTAQTIGVTVDGTNVGISTLLSVVPGAPSATNSTISVSAASVPVSQAVTVTAVIKDINNNGVSSGITVAFSATGGTSAGTFGSVTNLGSGSYSVNYTGTAKGSAQTLQASIGGVAFGPTATITVTAGVPHHLALIASPSPLNNMSCSGPFTINLQDIVNVSTSQATDMTLTFSSSGNVHNGVLYTDSSCSSLMSSTVTLPAFTETTSFYYMSTQPQNFNLSVSSSQAGVASTSFNVVTTPVLAWLGAGGVFTTSGSGSAIVGGDSDGGMVEPFDVYYDGTNIYVTDNNNSRIMRFDSNFNMTGWIGLVASTDGMTCQSGTPAVNSFTPSWCTGGRPLGTTASLLYQVRYLTSDGTYLYATQGNSVLRFLMSNGTYSGFMGVLSATNACGSSGAAVQWCASISASAGQATAAASSAIGGFNAAYGIKYAQVGGVNYLFIADGNNHRIVRIKTDGSGYGWVGLIGATAPTTPASCNGLTTGQTTTDWCTSGTSQASIRYALTGTPPTVPNEGFSTPYAVDVDTANGFLYVGEYGNLRISRWNLGGTFSAWIGGIPSSSYSIATPTPLNSYTSGWTVGGSTTYSTASQGFGNILKVRFDSNYIYFSDLYHRIGRVDKATGLNEKWIGRVTTTPTGGVAGCSATALGSPTPGWCTGGGANKYGPGSGSYNEPRGFDLVGSKIIVADRYNYRLQQIDTANGNFDRWIGMLRNSNLTTWRKDIVGFTRGGYDDSSLGVLYPSIAMGIAVDSLGNMFVSDQGSNRIKMYSKGSGNYLGYVGTFGTNPYSPTAPDDCVGVTSGMTPTWCLGGGRTGAASGVHGYSAPAALASDGTSLYIANVSNNRIDKVTISTGAYVGWIGKILTVPNDGPGCPTSAIGTITPNWCVGGTANTGTEYGALDGVRGLYVDGTTLYATDNRGRLYKISTSDGSTLGTVGSLSSGTGCTITATTASGWCTASVGGGNNSAYGRINAGQAVTADTNFIYVVDVSHRILRFNKSTGAPSGFISSLTNGTNLSTTTGACNNAGWIAQGYPKVTPGWCYATSLGVALSHASSALDGGLNDPRGVWTDSAGYLYVLDTGNHRIEKYDAASGTFLGWKGRVVTTPTGGDVGCTSLVSGDITPGWCTGGSSGQSSKMGGFDTPTALYGDSFYLYVVDSRNNRVQAVPR
ncbi:MAG: invasin domain 3-containing protein, partial [Bacillota bacterium]